MTAEILFVYTLTFLAAGMMASNRVRFDIVALLVVLALMLSGILSPAEALSGFGNTVVILVAGLLVVGETLDRTGVANGIGNVLLRYGGSNETRLLVLIMVAAAGLGAVMSSTAVVAIFIPIVLRISGETNISASRILMPMSYAALISGMLTLIATTPNLVVSEELKAAGYSGFGFFSFAPIGMCVLCLAVAYILLFGRGLLHGESNEDANSSGVRSILNLWDDYSGDRELRQLRVLPESPLISTSVAGADLAARYNVLLSAVRRMKAGVRWIPAEPNTEILQGDTVIAAACSKDLERLEVDQNLEPQPFSKTEAQRRYWEIGAATVLIQPESTLIGKTLVDVGFRDRYGLQVFGIRRDGQAIAEYGDTRLQASDGLLLIGPWHRIAALQSRGHDFVMLELPHEKAAVIPAYTKMSVAIGILVIMVLLTVFDVVPLVAAVMMAVMAAVFTRCLTMEDSYRAVPWSSLVLLAGMLPLADALEKTGGTQVIVDALMGSMGDSSPRVMLTVIFFLTATLGLFLSNTAAAVLVAPIAISSAEALDVSPFPLAVAVLIAASAAFVTPVSTPVVTLVVAPGRYQFVDFVKVGVPLLLLTCVATVVVAPLLFPFDAQ